MAVLDLIAESRTAVSSLEYDVNRTLNENLNDVFQMATELEEAIKAVLDQQNELDRVYNAAMTHIALNDRDGVPSKLRSYIAETRTLLQDEYNSNHTVTVKGTAINAIMENYNTDMKALIDRAEFYLNVDVGVKFLQDRYASSYQNVVGRLNTHVTALRAMEYDEAKDMSQNLADLQDAVNGYSVDLATLRQAAIRTDFEDYREYQAWMIEQNLTPTSSQAETSMVDEYAASVRAVQYNNRSIESNRYAVDRIVQEFGSRHATLVAEERKGDFDNARQALMGTIDAALQDGDIQSVRSAASEGRAKVQGFVYDSSLTYDDNVAQMTRTAELVVQHIRYVRVSAYAASADPNNDSNAFFMGVYDRISSLVVPDMLTGSRDYAKNTIYAVIISDKTQAEKSAVIEKTERDFDFIVDTLSGIAVRIDTELVLEDSEASRKIISDARAGILSMGYDSNLSYRENLAKADSFYDSFRTALREQRLLDNSATVGAIRADGRAMDGGVAEYPAGTDEIWGIVANETGLGSGASAAITRVSATVDLNSGSTSPASGSTVAVIGNGNVIGAFDITLYNDDEQVTSFTGTYRVKILLPADMRGYDSMQVAYVDEYGDVQVYDAKVEGNYLVFETVHFSTFYVVGLFEQHRHYDAYAYAAIAILVILILVYLMRVVRFDANGGTGRTSLFMFLGSGEGTLPASGYTREGYELAGWSRDREGTDIIPVAAELSALGKIHFLRLYAVWQKKGGDY